jgi:hypothetical protein
MVALASVVYLAFTALALFADSLSTFLCEFAEGTDCDGEWTAPTAAAAALWIVAGGALLRAGVAAKQHARVGGLARASGSSLVVASVCGVSALLVLALAT